MKKSGLSYGEILKIATRNIYKENSRIKKASTLNINPFDSINISENFIGDDIRKFKERFNERRKKIKRYFLEANDKKIYKMLEEFENYNEPFSVEHKRFVPNRRPTKAYFDKVEKAFEKALSIENTSLSSLKADILDYESTILLRVYNEFFKCLGIKTEPDVLRKKQEVLDNMKKVFEIEEYRFTEKDKKWIINGVSKNVYTDKDIDRTVNFYKQDYEIMDAIFDRIVSKIERIYSNFSRKTIDDIIQKMVIDELNAMDKVSPIDRHRAMCISVMIKVLDKDYNSSESSNPFESIKVPK